MADKKISALTAATTPLAGSEVLPIVQGGSTVKVSVNNLTAGKAVSTGIVTSTATTGSQAIYTGWSPTGGAHPANGSVDFGTSAANKGIVSYDSTGAFPGALYIENTYNDGSASTRIRLRGVDRIIAKGNGDVSIASGNVVMDTAGKGIDFSANAHAAGMTSELLNWYEEGACSMTVTATSGTITSSSVVAVYTRIGRSVTVTGAITITNNGTGAGALLIAGLPFTPSGNACGVGRERVNNGKTVSFMVSTSSTTLTAQAYDNTYPVSTNSVVPFSVTYTA